jgi:hypothetical protein
MEVLEKGLDAIEAVVKKYVKPCLLLRKDTNI